MDNINKEKLDALFQEGSERHDFTYREDAWEAMGGMLDEQDKQRKKRFFGWWILVGATALAGAFGIKHYTTDNSPSAAQVGQIKTIEKSNENTSESASAISNTNTTSSSTANTIVDKNSTLVINSNELVTPKEKVDLTKALNKTVLENTNKVITQKIALTGELVNTPSINNSESKVLNNPIVAEYKFDGNQQNVLSTLTEAKKPEEKNVVLIPTGTLESLSDNTNPLETINTPEIVFNENKGNPNAEKPKLKKKRFSVGLTVGPEYSFVGGSGREAKAGFYLGAELGYQLTDRFELITGVGISKKRYIGDGENYKTAPGFWTDEIAPMRFDGKGTVIEIPLAVNYYFNNAKGNGWFASLGATTFLMSSEWYDFIYDPAVSRPDLKANWNDKMANNHLLGVGQISFGYQRKIGNRMNLQVSPYAKIPLTGIGNGSVNLFSTGLRLTARFK